LGILIIPLLPSPRVVPLRLTTTQLVTTQAEPALTLPALTPSTAAARVPLPPAPARPARSEPALIKPSLIFPGPQEIVSVPPHADNLLQTVRQPDVPAPPRLKIPVAAPNILQTAASARPILVQPSVVELQANSQRRIPIPVRSSEQAARARLNLPLSGDSLNKSVNTLAANHALQPGLAAQSPAAALEGSGTDQRNLLILNALPSPSPANIPAGEFSGAFIVSPNPESSKMIAGATAIVSGSGSPTQSSKAGENSFVTETAIHPATDNHAKDRHGDSGLVGSGKATPPASIAIAQAPPLPAGNAVPRQAVPRGIYGMTIVANGSTGGGLRDYGVFKNEVVYTVYVQMSEPGRPRANWTLQYAAPSLPPSTLLSPPFPITKDYPNLPREVALRNEGRTIVVSGMITKDGKTDSLRIIQSPNPLLIQPILDCLAKWSFQAAEINGEAVTVKFVLGIPVAADPEEMK